MIPFDEFVAVACIGLPSHRHELRVLPVITILFFFFYLFFLYLVTVCYYSLGSFLRDQTNGTCDCSQGDL